MENVKIKIYKKYPGFIPFFILVILIVILLLYSAGLNILFLFGGGKSVLITLPLITFLGELLGIYAFVVLIIKIFKKQGPILLYLLTILAAIALFFLFIRSNTMSSQGSISPPTPRAKLCETDNDCVNVIVSVADRVEVQDCVNKNYKNLPLPNPADYSEKILSETGKDACICKQIDQEKICATK